LIEDKITEKTKAIMVVHYAGVACDMDKIMKIAKKHNLKVIEDAAQCIDAKHKGKYLGTIGDFGCLSFHGTKNVVAGEGGMLLINTKDEKIIRRAEIIREKGTNRTEFMLGQVDKYTWVDIGSSILPSDLLSALLYAQLENVEKNTQRRLHIYDKYFNALNEFQRLR
jgi:dTDP-4-amino-4,6-dideoxygalactose transaminase